MDHDLSSATVHDRTVSDSVMIALRKIIQAIDTNSKQLVKRVGLTGPQLVILQEITRMGEVTAGEIAQAVSLSQATVTGILERMEKRGLLARRRSERDKLDKIVVENLYKIFGDQPKKAMQLLKEGHNKESVHDKTGMTVGVDNASFSIEAGEIFVIMGLSGSGKSTIVRMLNRLIEPTAGKVIVDGKDVTR
jgi:ABC-type glutathione transport system ATPase component